MPPWQREKNMQISMVYRRGRHCPTILCDVCQEPMIEHGNVLWDPDVPDQLYVVHKGHCNQVMEAVHAPAHLYWEELSWFLVYLANNSKLPPPTLVKKEALIKEANL